MNLDKLVTIGPSSPNSTRLELVTGIVYESYLLVIPVLIYTVNTVCDFRGDSGCPVEKFIG